MSPWLRIKLKFGKLLDWDRANIVPFFAFVGLILFFVTFTCAAPVYTILSQDRPPASQSTRTLPCAQERLIDNLLSDILKDIAITPEPSPTPCP